MGFRRSPINEPGSSRWRRQHRDRLLECGMPETVLDSDRAFTYVLLHGDWPEMGWDCTWLSDVEAGRMLDFLRQEIANTLGYDLVAELERRLAHEEDGPPCSPA